MLFALMLVFIVVPIVEISILIQVGEQLGVVPTVALVVLTAAIGASLVRSQGLQTLTKAQEKIQQGQQPGQEMIEGVMLAMAGVLLVTPGFATDIFGLLILTPFTRKPIANYLLAKLVIKGAQGGPFGGQSPFNSDFSQPRQGDDFIDGEFSSKDHEQHLEDKDAKDHNSQRD